MEGMDLEKIRSIWGEDKITAMEKKLSILKKSNLLHQKDSIIQLTDEGMLMADGIASDLFTLIP